MKSMNFVTCKKNCLLIELKIINKNELLKKIAESCKILTEIRYKQTYHETFMFNSPFWVLTYRRNLKTLQFLN